MKAPLALVALVVTSAAAQDEPGPAAQHDDAGTINRNCNSPPTPAFYVLDPRGVIRHKWIGYPGEHIIDAAAERLLEDLP